MRHRHSQTPSIHQLFEKRVQINPEAVAVVFQGKQLTYQELNSKANQLAHYLQGLGIKPELPVGICVDRSLEMVIGLLGVVGCWECMGSAAGRTWCMIKNDDVFSPQEASKILRNKHTVVQILF